MAVHRGRLRQAALALTTAFSRIRFCTGTLGTAAAKCSKSTTVRRGSDNRTARPRIGSLRGVIRPRELDASCWPYSRDIHRRWFEASYALPALHEKQREGLPQSIRMHPQANLATATSEISLRGKTKNTSGAG